MSQPLPFEFNPIRDELYTERDLFDLFDPADADSYARMPDTLAYAFFMRNKNPATRRNSVATLQALHDNAITQCAEKILDKFKHKVTAIMGGHKMVRGSPEYMDVVEVSAALTAKGLLVCSGGGPGAMEATHFGALAASVAAADRAAYAQELASEPLLPANAGDLYKTGQIDPSIARALHKWFAPAMKVNKAIRQQLAEKVGESLAVPTWLYGHEPSTPFATSIAKYFQNSLREDGLVTLADAGIVYTEGKAGTLQEVFQDAAQNYYDVFRPMVFLSPRAKPKYWSDPATGNMPAEPLVKALLEPKNPALFAKRVLFTADPAEAVDFLVNQKQ